MYRSSARETELLRENERLHARLVKARLALRKKGSAALVSWLAGTSAVLCAVVLAAALVGSCLAAAASLDRTLGIQ